MLAAWRPSETIIHALWECKGVKNIWKQSQFKSLNKTFLAPTFADVFTQLCSLAVLDDLEMFGTLAWWIWRNRNLHRHGEPFLKPKEVCIAAAEWYIQFVEANLPQPSQPKPVREGFSSVWTPPPICIIRMNFDAAVSKVVGFCGLGIVFRNAV